MREFLNHFVILFILVLFVMGVFYSVAPAETATVDEARRVCRNWLTYMLNQKGVWGKSGNPTIAAIKDITANDTVLARCFVINPSGYIVVPVLKELPPVKACSEKYNLELEAPDGFAVMLKEVLQHRTRLYVENYGSMEAKQPAEGDVLLGRNHRRQWDKFLVTEDTFLDNLASEERKDTEEFGPLLTTLWHQGDPYNQLCPWGDGGRCVVGCVATATAQILAYHQWPPTGTGTHDYYWGGDNSCGGSTSGAFLSADYSDPYDWENIPDYCGSCSAEQEAALAELNYEVGVAFNMHYGNCGSGAYTSDAQHVFPDYFRYYDQVEKKDRADYLLIEWSDIIKAEIEANRPIQYRINSHSIVCDGWRYPVGSYQVHMNYGWGGGHNTWYTIDELYCPWTGCTPLVEFAITNIIPDRGVEFSSDTAWGDVPLQVAFTGNSDLEVDSWTWDFGDGDSAFIQSPTHSYTENGRYDVTLQVTAGEEIRSYMATNYITALADSMCGGNAQDEPGSTVEVEIYVRNTVPLRSMIIPIEYSGSLNLTLDSFSVTGCRTDYFDQVSNIALDTYNRRSAYRLQNTESSTPDLEMGNGPVLKVYFTIPETAEPGQSTSIVLDGFYSYFPKFFSPVLDFTPKLEAGLVTLPYLCGDVNNDGIVNIFDATYLISYLYMEGPPPDPLASSNVNNDDDINIFDVTYLISFLYNSGPEPDCP